MANFKRQVRRKRIRVCMGCWLCTEQLGEACTLIGGTIVPKFMQTEVTSNEEEKRPLENESEGSSV